METQTSARRSRRAVLGAAIGGAAALAATTVTRPTGVQAADGDTALIGAVNEGTAVTVFENQDAAATSLEGRHAGAGTGVSGTSFTGPGVEARATQMDPLAMGSNTTALWAVTGSAAGVATNTSETGVYGYADTSGGSAGVWGDTHNGTGVFGSGSVGVYGLGNYGVIGDVGPTGVGVYGWTGEAYAPAPPMGVGVYARAETSSQVALQVAGKVKLSRSGRTSIGSTATTKTISMAGVTTSSYIVATMQTNVSGVYVRAVVPASGSFKIYLSKAAGKTVVVGYVVIN